MDYNNTNGAGKCPFHHGEITNAAGSGTRNKDWWPNKLDLGILRMHSNKSNPMDEDFNYKKEFNSLDFAALKQDIADLMTDSQDWWPADYGHYGPFFIRMAWHAAGTYRISDGRGGAGSGTQRFAPLNSWPDNANLDKARLLLWPIKQKYGKKISWADLMVLTGNIALETMGFEPYGFGAGREDVWEAEEDIYWGSESEWLGDKRYKGERELENPLAAVQMGLIYVNPEGPNGNPDPKLAAHDIRETFGRMAMNDEETVALIAGGHTFGKTHGAADASKYVGNEPESAPMHMMSMGWENKFESGKAEHTITSGLEGAWTTTPAQWSHDYFKHLFEYEWELTKSPAGAHQWKPKGDEGSGTVPDAHEKGKSHQPIMLTTDLSLRFDPAYESISRRFYEHPEKFKQAFAKAWFKLMHRDMGPIHRYLGPEVPKNELIWQDPVPERKFDHLSDSNINELKNKIQSSGLSISELVSTAWASASTYRNSDKRGGANGARIRLEPQRNWEVNNPEQLEQVLEKLENIQQEFNASQSGKQGVSIADLIVLGGSVGIEEAAKLAGHEVTVPFCSGRTDASQAQTDVESFEVLEPFADAWRNYFTSKYEASPEEVMVDKAQLLGLTSAEMAVLLGGMRVLGANYDASDCGVFTDTPGVLTNDFFKNVLDLGIKWEETDEKETKFIGLDRTTGKKRWQGCRVDLVFGSNSELRAISEVYASSDSQEKFIQDFIKAWIKVMNLDRTC